MKFRYLFFLLPLGFWACTSASNGDAETVTVKWLELLDNENFKELKDLSTGNTLVFVNDMEQLFDGVSEDGGEGLPPTIVERINCENKEEGTHCTYCCKDGEEETFVLVQEGGKWKVTDIIVSLDDLDKEAREKEKILEDLLNDMLKDTLEL